MTLKSLIKWYVLSMVVIIYLMSISFFQLGLILLALNFIFSVVAYFRVKCIECSQSFGVFAERISFKSFSINKCSKCLKNKEKKVKNIK